MLEFIGKRSQPQQSVPPLHCGIWLTVVGSVFQIDSQWIEDAFKVDGLPDTLVGAHSHGLVCVVFACQKTD
jgi:hypothetical protein